MSTKGTIAVVDGQAPPRFIPSTRFTLALLVFFAFIVQYSQRVNLPIAIVCMVNRTKSGSPPLTAADVATTSYGYSKNIRYPLTTTIKPAVNSIQKGGFFKEKQFYWAEIQQQMLLGGYWAGYIFTQIPGKYSFLFFI